MNHIILLYLSNNGNIYSIYRLDLDNSNKCFRESHQYLKMCQYSKQSFA